MGYSWLITACYYPFSSRHAGASIGLPAQDILVTVKLSGVVTMGYSWLITARCGYHVLSMQNRAWDGRRGTFILIILLWVVCYFVSLNVAW